MSDPVSTIDPDVMSLEEFIQARRDVERASVSTVLPLSGTSQRRALATLSRMDSGYLESEYHRLRTKAAPQA